MDGWYGTVIALVVGVLFIGRGLPLTRGQVPPNRWYG
jgi:hypothetical protein